MRSGSLRLLQVWLTYLHLLQFFNMPAGTGSPPTHLRKRWPARRVCIPLSFRRAVEGAFWISRRAFWARPRLHVRRSSGGGVCSCIRGRHSDTLSEGTLLLQWNREPAC